MFAVRRINTPGQSVLLNLFVGQCNTIFYLWFDLHCIVGGDGDGVHRTSPSLVARTKETASTQAPSPSQGWKWTVGSRGLTLISRVHQEGRLKIPVALH